MTKKQYLSELKACLKFKIPENVIEDIVSDMSECFDSGKAEGKTDDEISAYLGNPKDAAHELVMQRSDPTKGFSPEILARIICFVSALALTTYGCISSYESIPFFVYAVPLLLWASSEGRSTFSALKKRSADIFLAAGSILLLLGTAVISDFPRLMLERSGNALPSAIFSCVLICLSLAMVIISVWRSAPKWLIAFPAAGIIASAAFTVYGWNFFETYGSDVGYNAVYMNFTGKYIRAYTVFIIICCICYLIWVFIGRNALSVPGMYSCLAALMLVKGMYNYYSNFDPYAIYDNAGFSSGRYFAGGIAAFAVSAVVIFAVRHTERRKA
jgi:hypothetical protein